MLRGLHTLSIWALSAILVVTLSTGVFASARGMDGTSAHAETIPERQDQAIDANGEAPVSTASKPEGKSPCKEGIATCASFTCTAFTLNTMPASVAPSGLLTAMTVGHSIIPDERAPATADEPPRPFS